MTKKRVFISFDHDNDKDLPGNLIAQERDSASPLSFNDMSVKEPIDHKWKREVRDRIRRSDVVVVMCGEHTHQASGVAAELTIAREENKPYILLRGRSKKTCTKPGNALRDDKMHTWKRNKLSEAITDALER